MKHIKTILILILAVCMMTALTACGSDAVEGSTPPVQPESPSPSPSPSASAPEKPEIASGTYRFDMIDDYGDTIVFTIVLKADCTANILALDAGDLTSYSGAAWIDNGDNTFTTGKSDPKLDFSWSASDGSVTWIVDGDSATPEGYVEPTEFLVKTEKKDPTTAAEAVGVYLFGSVNSRGSELPYVLWLNANGTSVVHMINSFLGVRSYYAGEWTFSDGVVHMGPITEATGDIMGAWWNDTEGVASDWKVYGDGTCAPVLYTDQIVPVSASAIEPEYYPAGAFQVGVYTFGQTNAFGSVVPYVLWLNADGTATVHMNNSFTGLRSYYADEWSVNADGTIYVGALSSEVGTPMGDWFDEATGFTSNWTLNSDGTCVPVGYTDTVGRVEIASLPAEIYPS